MFKTIQGQLLMFFLGILMSIAGCKKCYICHAETGYYICYKAGISDTIPWISNNKQFRYPYNDSTYSCVPVGFHSNDLEGCDRNFLLRNQSFSNCIEQ